MSLELSSPRMTQTKLHNAALAVVLKTKKLCQTFQTLRHNGAKHQNSMPLLDECALDWSELVISTKKGSEKVLDCKD